MGGLIIYRVKVLYGLVDKLTLVQKVMEATLLMRQKVTPAFTLAELLVALAILGIIAIFTIPKIVSSQRNGNHNAKAKEAASMIAATYSLYRQNNVISASTSPGDLTSYMNYVKLDTSAQVDWEYGTTGSETCSSVPCLRLHNGGILYYYGGNNFAGTASTNAIFYYFDPDGVSDGTATNSGKSVLFWLYTNGRITSWTNASPNTVSTAVGSPYGPNASADPPWFSW
jgi:prepilin-type N-terminal cleavage/methylation domain-containing protein